MGVVKRFDFNIFFKRINRLYLSFSIRVRESSYKIHVSDIERKKENQDIYQQAVVMFFKKILSNDQPTSTPEKTSNK